MSDLLNGQERITVGCQEIVTLKERLRPGLSAVLVGINPTPVSVKAGHYYQGTLGKRLWSRLQGFGLLSNLRAGKEDEIAFKAGFGFADVVRFPTSRAQELSTSEKARGAEELTRRLSALPDRPLVIFVFAEADKFAGVLLRKAGFSTFRMPGPYASREIVSRDLASLKGRLEMRI